MAIPSPNLEQGWRGLRARQLAALVLLLLMGLTVRWLNLSDKVFWHDEVFTLFRAVGHWGPAAEQALFTGQPITAADLLQFQTFAPGSTLADTGRSLLAHPEHPPLYYLLAWAWVSLWGPSVTAVRSLSVVFSLLTFPALGVLSQELYPCLLPRLLLLLLVAVSPVHVVYAQEAREYSLWVCLIVMAGWALLRALRRQTVGAWSLYALLLALLFYTSLLSALGAIAYGLYGLWRAPRRQWPAVIAAHLAAIALFSPWIAVIITRLDRLQAVTAWTTAAYPRLTQIKLWGLHFTALVVDPNLPLSHPYTVTIPPLVLLAIGFSLYRCWRQYSRATSGFILSLTLVPTLALIGGDLLRGTILSVHTRYFFPALIGAHLAIAGALGQQWPRAPRRIGSLVGALFLVGLVNVLVIVNAETWWNKGVSAVNAYLGALIRSFEDPVILTQQQGTTLGNLISLSYEVPADTRFVVTQSPQIPMPPATATTVLLLNPEPALRQAYGCEVVPLPGAGNVWQIPCR